MANIHAHDKHPNCPLCLKPFKKIVYPKNQFYICFTDMISINVKDPCIHLWAEYKPETEREILCPSEKCRAPMRFFFRQDGYMKSKCTNKYCQATVSSEELPDRAEFQKKWGYIGTDEEIENQRKWREHWKKRN